jgi:hypothetical protein
LSTLGIIQSVIKTELREAIDNESVDAWVIKTAAFIDKIQIELGATQHAFTDYRASYAMKACMMCNSLERVHCYANTEKLEDRVAELEARQINYDRLLVMATKWCDVKHNDWQEILLIATGEVTK